jgi:UDP-hydrolysing UDP-N-acetyl-D-glucosamine 2-epimerase
MKRKIAIFSGSRSTWGRLKSVCKAINEHDALELQLILGASFYNHDVSFPVDSRIQCLINADDHEGMALTTGILLMKVSAELVRLKPDIVLVHGDRYEVLAVAQAAAYLNIPLAHTEGGEVTGCIDDKVRNAITALADIHFAVTRRSGGWIAGLRNDSPYIHVVGSTALDSIRHIRTSNIEKDNDKILVMLHPNTTEEEDVDEFIAGINMTGKEVRWVNPNIDAGHMGILQKMHATNWGYFKNLDIEEYAKLMKSCSCVVGNSSSFIKEASFLGIPAVIVGNRQKNREVDTNVIRVPVDRQRIEEAVICQSNAEHVASDYFGDGTADIKIANILAEVKL